MRAIGSRMATRKRAVGRALDVLCSARFLACITGHVAVACGGVVALALCDGGAALEHCCEGGFAVRVGARGEGQRGAGEEGECEEGVWDVHFSFWK